MKYAATTNEEQRLRYSCMVFRSQVWLKATPLFMTRGSRWGNYLERFPVIAVTASERVWTMKLGLHGIRSRAELPFIVASGKEISCFRRVTWQLPKLFCVTEN